MIGAHRDQLGNAHTGIVAEREQRGIAQLWHRAVARRQKDLEGQARRCLVPDGRAEPEWAGLTLRRTHAPGIAEQCVPYDRSTRL